MIAFIRELRRREVFRTVGLYVGVCWILIEAASILLPTFGAPTWLLRWLVIAAVVGFPVAAVLAWIFDITERGVGRQAATADASVPGLGQRRMDFVVIGVLTVALVFSVYLNVRETPANVEMLEPVSVVLADFENGTGETIFDGLVEQALTIGIERAPHVAFYDRHAADALGAQLQPRGDGLDVERARLVAVREGIDLVLAGTIEPEGGGFRLALRGLEPVAGAASFVVSAGAASREDVLKSIDSLSNAAREALGDDTSSEPESATAETFTAASIEAASAYVEGIELAYIGRQEEAIEQFRVATTLDPDFGRAHAGWATSEFRLGRTEQATAQWNRALSLMDGMTERERLRTLGLYYIGVTRNYEEAVETFSELVEKYPADAAGRNNLAVAAFLALDFARAAAEGARVLEIFPSSPLYRVNHALYAMYSGRFEAAAAEARALVESDPEYGSAYLPLAVASLERGDVAGAREAYEHMAAAEKTEHGESLAMLGRADASIYVGELDRARELLREGISRDLGEAAMSAAAVKQIALAETFVVSSDYSLAVDTAKEALELSTRDSIRIAAAIVFVESGQSEAARAIADELARQVNAQSRAYAGVIRAEILARTGEHIAAIQMLRSALDIADLWRVRYALGRTYLEAGYFAEAFDELQSCTDRRGEAAAMFLDDVPTFRYLADLPYWLGRAQDGLGMRNAALRNYEQFLARWQAGPLADDAIRRLE